MSTVADVVQWCDEVRNVLKIVRKPWDPRHKLASELDRVRQNIQNLQSLITHDQMNELLEEFDKVRVVVSNAVKETDPKLQKTQIKEAEAQFDEFDTTVQQKLKEAQKLAAKKAKYEDRLHRNEIELAMFKKYPDLHGPMNTLIIAAKEHATKVEFDLATGKLGEFEKLLKTNKTEKEKRDKQQLEWEKKRPGMEQRLDEVNETLSAIVTLPGVTTQIDSYKLLINNTTKFLNQGKLKEAWDELEKLKNLPTKDEINLLSTRAIESKKIDLKGYANAYDKVTKGLIGIKELVDGFIYRDYEQRLELYNRQIVNGSEPEAALDSLKKLGDEIAERTKTATSQKSTVERLAPDITRMLDELQKEFDSVEISSLVIEREKLQLLIDTRDFEPAAVRAPKLYNDVFTTHRQMLDAKSVYEGMSGEIEDLKKSLAQVQKDWPGGNTRFGPISWRITTATKLSTSDPNVAGNMIVEAREDFEEVKRAFYDPYMSLKAKRDKWIEEVKALVRTADEGVSQLQLAVKAHRTQNNLAVEGVVSQPLEFKGVIEANQNRWLAGHEKIHVESELQKLFDDVCGKLRDTISEIQKADVEELANGQVLQESQIAYTQLLEQLNGEIKSLESVSASEAERFMKSKSQVEQIAQSGKFAEAIKEAKSVIDAVKLCHDEFTGEGGTLATLRLTAQQIRTEVMSAFKSLEKLLGKKIFRDSPYKPYLEKLRLEIDDLDTLLASNTEVAISRASLEYTKLKSRITEFATELSQLNNAPGTQVQPEEPKGFKAVNLQLEWLQEFLKDVDLKELAKAKKEVYTKQVESLKELAYENPPSRSLPELLNARKAMEEFKVLLTSRRQLRLESEELAKRASEALKSLPPKLEYTKDLKARLATSKTTANTEDKEELGKQQLTNLLTEITTAKTNPDVMESKEVALRQAKESDVQRTAVLRERLKLAQNYITDAKMAVTKNDGDETLIDELNRLKDMANDSLKKQQLDKAERDIDLIQIRANVIVQNPFGSALGSRKELSKNLAVYEKAVTEFKDIIRALASNIETLDDNSALDPQAIKSVRQATSTLAVQFSAADAAGPIGTLLTKGTAKADLRKAREEILSVMRRETKKLVDSPLIVQLRDNTIDPVAIPQSLKKLENAIDRIIGNTLRSVQ